VDANLEARRREALEVSESLRHLLDDTERLPESEEEAKAMVAARGVDRALSLPHPSLTREQVAVAYLHGRGLRLEKAAEAVGVPPSLAQSWFRSMPDFRAEIAVQRESKASDIEADLYESISEMLADEELKPDVRVKLLSVADDTAKRIDARRRDAAHIQLKREDLALRRRQSRGPSLTDADARVVAQVDAAQDDVMRRLSTPQIPDTL